MTPSSARPLASHWVQPLSEAIEHPGPGEAPLDVDVASKPFRFFLVPRRGADELPPSTPPPSAPSGAEGAGCLAACPSALARGGPSPSPLHTVCSPPDLPSSCPCSLVFRPTLPPPRDFARHAWNPYTTASPSPPPPFTPHRHTMHGLSLSFCSPFCPLPCHPHGPTPP